MEIRVPKYYPSSPFNDSNVSKDQIEQLLDMKSMVAPILSGILSALRRVISRRISLKNQLKRRLHATTIASATCFLFLVAMWDMIGGSSKVELPFSPWPFSSTILFGIILIFYMDSIADERLHMVFSSPRHIMVAGRCLIVMEIFYKMDFSLPGFFIRCTLLGFGIYEATSLDCGKKDNVHSTDITNGIFGTKMRDVLFQREVSKTHSSLSGSVDSMLLGKFNASSFVANVELCGYSISTPCPAPHILASPSASPVILPSSNKRTCFTDR